MMEARIPTRQWANYDLATMVARDDKKQSRFHATHIEGNEEESAAEMAARKSKDSA
jgi:hypothetical protein